ncbi:MAG TPA: patatin-like phospholipase family protein [Leptospiraceae bacterium]|nr:patatin-like phospholipase family protein [Leptospiraceae bacterium]HMW03941.1 patatin-like phospholipase family protein [Leptospiraceae bacterium]HMX33160.1 patatin-like phospholipase family protein [Leptospiraceae bacterium]HMY29921.1 patatin-like phospholipase family protein [Leptospiraceae bacterium]HMZ67125.1 patatin-like phospholipase family protein [Leptospiraceae bacterium]
MKRGLILSGGGARGAYQAGVYKYLNERNFIPDVICGTSVGALNATALGCGFTPEKLIQLWRNIDAENVMRYSIWQNIKNIFLRKFTPMVDTTPLKNLLAQELDFRKLRTSSSKVYISAVNIKSSELTYFSNDEIDIQHLMASSAIPVVFPWQYVNGEPYWDGGLMANTPIAPAIDEEAKDIVVVLLSPVGKVQMEMPKSRKEALERVFEMTLIASYQAIRSNVEFTEPQPESKSFLSFLDYLIQSKNLRLRTVSPKNFLGLRSILNFSQLQADSLIEMGYNDAKEQLGSI